MTRKGCTYLMSDARYMDARAMRCAMCERRIARAEARVAFEGLASRPDATELAAPEALAYANRFTVRGFERLDLRFEPGS